MLLEEFDAEKYERTLRAEGREEGRKEGIEESKKEDIAEFIDALKELKIPVDEIKQQLMKRFKLSAEAAEGKIAN